MTGIKRESYREQELKSIKTDLFKTIRSEEDVTVRVKVYDCSEGEQTYDVEVQYGIGEEIYTGCFVSDTYTSSIYDDDVCEKMAVTRAKSVLRTVKKWFDGSEDVTVEDSVEVYRG